ncbi:uncharacterized protein ALTATR162_LOCUS5008 [Alternaria atra]|uniref:Zn(2)-C6 fungal-type domain-containing protein n=1 Tax=Alternaria atra TaxID=119953 RepID=A0A8J2HZH5_9PLEO|nr:uncharacterized protein ALTATR162_LOCUS5008 [Alternaria atra]CAG5158150.1 unnamed protein product [Alternaria atra]
MKARKRPLGHLDKRKKVTRCQSCLSRRIKCEGGIPCRYCVRNDKDCLPQTVVHGEIKFIAVTEIAPVSSTMPSQLSRQDDDVYLDLFAAFIRRCQFTSGFVSVDSDLISLIYTSPLLHNLAVAIGALEASRRVSCSKTYESRTAQVVAFKSYGRAIAALRSRLTITKALHFEDVLWGSFLLGLFELISETSGERFAQHMLLGMLRLLQLNGPVQSWAYLRRKLVDAFRVLEANRAILFGNGTCLSQPVWLLSQPGITARENIFSDPTEAILVLKIQMASFSKRFFDQIESIPKHRRPFHPAIQALAFGGVVIGQKLTGQH